MPPLVVFFMHEVPSHRDIAVFPFKEFLGALWSGEYRA